MTTPVYRQCPQCGHTQQVSDIEGVNTYMHQKLERIGKLIAPYDRKGMWNNPLLAQLCRDIGAVIRERRA